MNNEIGFFLNLDQGAMSAEQVVAMLARNGYQCIEYSLLHLHPQQISRAGCRSWYG